jgi:hypothetical protein
MARARLSTVSPWRAVATRMRSGRIAAASLLERRWKLRAVRSNAGASRAVALGGEMKRKR